MSYKKTKIYKRLLKIFPKKKYLQTNLLPITLSGIFLSFIFYNMYQLHLSVNALENSNLILGEEIKTIKESLNEANKTLAAKEEEIKTLISSNQTTSQNLDNNGWFGPKEKKILFKTLLIGTGLTACLVITHHFIPLIPNPVFWVFNKTPIGFQKLCANYIPGLSTVVATGTYIDPSSGNVWTGKITNFGDLYLSILQKDGSDPMPLTEYLTRLKQTISTGKTSPDILPKIDPNAVASIINKKSESVANQASNQILDTLTKVDTNPSVGTGDTSVVTKVIDNCNINSVLSELTADSNKAAASATENLSTALSNTNIDTIANETMNKALVLAEKSEPVLNKVSTSIEFLQNSNLI